MEAKRIAAALRYQQDLDEARKSATTPQQRQQMSHGYPTPDEIWANEHPKYQREEPGDFVLAQTGSPLLATAAHSLQPKNITKGLGDWSTHVGDKAISSGFELGPRIGGGNRVMNQAAGATLASLAADPSNLLGTGSKVAIGIGALGGVIKKLAAKPGSTEALLSALKAQKIVKETKKDGGYSLNLPSGQTPSGGLMMGKYANNDPRNTVIDGLKGGFNRRAVEQFVEKNKKALDSPDAFLGTWIDPDTGTVYLDVSNNFPSDKLRKATKAGERSGQLAGWDVGQSKEFPVGNWRDFVDSPAFDERVVEMGKVGNNYLKDHPTAEWWDMPGTSFERVYGSENLPQVAGFTASTAPVRSPKDNLEDMSEYMRRHLAGEPTIQPDWRVPDSPEYARKAGGMVPFEQAFKNNLNVAKTGDYNALGGDKVRNEAQAMMGDATAVVLDRHWARISESPAKGIFAAVDEGKIGSSTKGGVSDYQHLKNAVTRVAEAQGRSPRDYSADVWTGIRETIKTKSDLFGQPYKGSAILGDSKSYADVLDDLIKAKASRMKISVGEMERKLRNGDANLMSAILATPIGYLVYQASQDSGQQSQGRVDARL